MGVGGGVGRGNGNVRSMQHLHQHPPPPLSHRSDRHEMSVLSSRDTQSRDSSGAIGGDVGGPTRMGMSVQDLKQMTALRMAQQQHQQGGQGSGSPRQSPPGTSKGQSSRSMPVHPQELGGVRPVSSGPPHVRAHTPGPQQSQHQPGPRMMPQLSRHSSAQAVGVGGYSTHQNGGGRAQLVVTQVQFSPSEWVSLRTRHVLCQTASCLPRGRG